MKHMPELITVPTFTFNQGDIINGDVDVEVPISVDYYNGCICLRQDGDYDKQEEIKIHPKHVKAFFKEVLKHLPDAEYHLKNRS
jgi:hypothetical protein